MNEAIRLVDAKLQCQLRISPQVRDATLRSREEYRRGQVFAEEESTAQRGDVGGEGGEADVGVFAVD